MARKFYMELNFTCHNRKNLNIMLHKHLYLISHGSVKLKSVNFISLHNIATVKFYCHKIFIPYSMSNDIGRGWITMGYRNILNCMIYIDSSLLLNTTQQFGSLYIQGEFVCFNIL